MFQETPWTLNQTMIRMKPVKSKITKVKKLAKDYPKKSMKNSTKKVSKQIKKECVKTRNVNKFITFKLFGWLVVLKKL